MAGVNVDRASAGRPSIACRASILGVLALGGLALSGCTNELDSFWDPSVVGRWEYTPTVVPILERIDVIEDDSGEYVERSEILPEDLIPEAMEYEISPGDQLLIEIFDFLAPNVPSQFQRIVDGRGNIDLPQLGRISVLGLTARQIEMRIVEELRAQGFIQDGLVTVQALAQREATYSVLGAVPRVGRYIIPAPNFRLLDALTEAGGIPPTIRTVFIIRSVPLTDDITMGQNVDPAKPPAAQEGETPDDQGANLEDLIERLTEPEPPSPSSLSAYAWQESQSQTEDRRQRLIDLPATDQTSTSRSGAESPEGTTEGQWVFLNGEWVRVATTQPEGGAGLAEGPDPIAGAQAEDLVTQRVIEVPTRPLFQGNASYNVVIRPGDTIHVPGAEQGFVYVAGRGIARPGVYNLPAAGRLTLTKAIMAAGGLSQVGIPSRTDLTRMVSKDRQATIRLNLNAIFEGTEPDVFLKADDVVNVGTTWWAQPLAVARNGFRATYGFGFLLDRNFGNDVFGAPPVNRGF